MAMVTMHTPIMHLTCSLMNRDHVLVGHYSDNEGIVEDALNANENSDGICSVQGCRLKFGKYKIF